MGDLDKYIQKVTNLDSYIENALNHEVAEVVRRILTETARELVYDAYTPRFVSRRGDPGGDYDGNTHGGITDPNSVKIEARGNTLTATDNAGWQQLWGGNIPSERLVDAIASGDRRFNMHRAGPRPFHDEAKKRIIATAETEMALRKGLERQGLDMSGVKFEFE